MQMTWKPTSRWELLKREKTFWSRFGGTRDRLLPPPSSRGTCTQRLERQQRGAPHSFAQPQQQGYLIFSRSKTSRSARRFPNRCASSGGPKLDRPSGVKFFRVASMFVRSSCFSVPGRAFLYCCYGKAFGMLFLELPTLSLALCSKVAMCIVTEGLASAQTSYNVT